jgi:hypothetical protein
MRPLSHSARRPSPSFTFGAGAPLAWLVAVALGAVTVTASAQPQPAPPATAPPTGAASAAPAAPIEQAAPPAATAPGSTAEPAPAPAPTAEAQPVAPPGYRYVRAAPVPDASSDGSGGLWQRQGASPKRTQYRWGFEAAARIVRLSTSGYEPYTNAESFTSSALGAHYQLLTRDRLSLHVGGEWGVGSLDNSAGAARGESASLTAHRFALGAIVRYRALRWVSPAVRVMPYAQYVRASVTPSDSPSRYDAHVWGAGAEATLGAHFVPITIGDVDWPSARIWIFVEAGWTMTTKSTMTFSPHQADDDPRRLNDLHLPKVALSGYVSRFGLSASF